MLGTYKTTNEEKNYTNHSEHRKGKFILLENLSSILYDLAFSTGKGKLE